MDCVLIPFFVLFGSLLFFFVWCFVPSQAEQMKKFPPSTILPIISPFQFNWKLLFICCSLIYQVNDKISTHTDCGCADLKDKVLEVISSVFVSKAHLKILFYQCSNCSDTV